MTLVQLSEASSWPSGIADACPVQAACGGCPLLPENRETQRALKLQWLREALAAQGLSAGPIDFCASRRGLGYRNRIRVQVLPGGTLRFFNASKALGCAVLEPALQAALTAVIELSREKPHIFVEYGHVELRAPDLRGRFGLCLAAQVERPDPTPLLEALARDQRVWLVGVAGAVDLPCQEFSPDGTLRVDVPLDAFWQINSEVNQLLVNAVVALALEHGAGAALDLYAGCGNFSLPLAARGLTVTAVERGASACRALARTAERSGFDVTAECSSVELACQRSYDDRRTFDFAILDAPRAGAERALLDLCGLAPRTIAVCSCNPKTLARDLATLVAAGYRLQRLTAFDMFPHTRHIETLACLQRG